MRKALPIVVAVLALVAAACGGGDDDPTEVRAGQSGEPPAAEEATTTTTEPETTDVTLPLEVVEVPDVSDLGLTWDEAPVVDEATGNITTGPFNRFMIETPAPNGMMPPGTFDDLDLDEAQDLLEEVLPEAPAKAVTLYLGLEPGDDQVQLLVGPAGGPEAFRVVVVRNVEDDSIRAERWEFRVQNQALSGLVAAEEETQEAEEGLDGEAVEEDEGATGSEATPGGVEEEVDTEGEAEAIEEIIPLVYGGIRTIQCQPGRGHQDFTIGECV